MAAKKLSEPLPTMPPAWSSSPRTAAGPGSGSGSGRGDHGPAASLIMTILRGLIDTLSDYACRPTPKNRRS